MLKDLSGFTQKFIYDVGNKFALKGDICSFEIHGNGNVNDTFLLYCEDQEGINRYTLQRINHEVFKDPAGLMENFSKVTNHLGNKIVRSGCDRNFLSLISTKEGKSYTRDTDGNYWRVTRFIDGGRSFDVPENPRHAYEAAKAFGEFQADLSDLSCNSLVETIPDFHNTKLRLEHFRSIVRKDSFDRLKEVEDLVDFAINRTNLAESIKGEDFPVRIVHNDTKLNNVLLHKSSGEGMCVVDLDTVMPGCALHDFGDLVRTAACSGVEDEKDLEKVNFVPSIFEMIVKGYLETAGNMLVRKEVEHLAIAPQVITYELGLRFLGDFLDGDTYFKIKRPGHNIDRTRTQFKLLTSMEENSKNMEAIVNKFSKIKIFA